MSVWPGFSCAPSTPASPSSAISTCRRMGWQQIGQPSTSFWHEPAEISTGTWPSDTGDCRWREPRCIRQGRQGLSVVAVRERCSAAGFIASGSAGAKIAHRRDAVD